MSKNEVPTTSPFATANTNADDVKALIEVGLEHMKPNGAIEWSEVADQTDIGYARGWLIVRRAYLEAFQPSSLEVLPTDPDPDKQFRKQCDHVIHMRDVQKLSWGEIMVRLGKTEGEVRKLYRKNGLKKDLGLRIGKGGRFAYDDPTLYQENRKVEGAHIPLDHKGRPTPEMLLNFDVKEKAGTEGKSTARQQAWAKGKITKLLKLRNDPATPKEQYPAIDEKVAELRQKYNLAA